MGRLSLSSLAFGLGACSRPLSVDAGRHYHSFGQHNCDIYDLSHFGKTISPHRKFGRCTRRAITAEYLAQEANCAVREGPNGIRLYQFGVPTEMADIIPRLREFGIRYTSYLGFDSFQGLPPEDTDHSQVPPGDVWAPGMFSEVHRRSDKFKTVKSKNGIQHYVPQVNDARPLTVEEAADSWRHELNATGNRIRLVPGFYNESLTDELAANAPTALYVDINCDLYISTLQALDWLFRHRIARSGTLISYDDWYEVPLHNGESLAHEEIAVKYLVDFEHLPHQSCKQRRRLHWFRVRSVGKHANASI